MTHAARFSTLALFIALLAPAAARAALPDWLKPITLTAEPFIGVTHYQITQSLDTQFPYILPRELSIHIIEIDPTAPGISFFGTPGNGNDPEEYTRQTTGNFVNTHDLALAINGDFYSTNTGGYASVNGLGMSNGTVVSPSVSGWYSFVIRENNTAFLYSGNGVPNGAFNAVSGNQRIVNGGLNVAPNNSYTNTLNPHTAIGVDDANGHIFFMVVDGRQTNFSEGMRTSEMADMLIDFGVDRAINLDGGGSSTLVFADGPAGAARAVNSPSDGSSSQSPGNQRSVANHLGVFATPNPNYTPLPVPARPPSAGADLLLTSFTLLDNFETGEGRFTSNPFTGSGSTNGITAASTADVASADAHLGFSSQKIVMVRDGSPSGRLRHLSGGGAPVNNRVEVEGQHYAMAPVGHVGFFLKTTDADLKVSIGIDDGGSGGTTGLEISTPFDVIPDGRWHLYQWNLADAGQWNNFSGGNGAIGGPNAYIDSIFLFSGESTANQSLTVWLDAVAYNPHGSLDFLDVDLSGDFNYDVAVTEADLAVWRLHFGAGPGGDADNDGVTDGHDFLRWQQTLGNSITPPSFSLIPEPPALTLILPALLAATPRRRFALP